VKAAGGVLICSRVFSAHRPGTHRGRRRLSCKGLVGGGALDTPGARPVWAYGGWRCNGQPQVVKGRGSIVAAAGRSASQYVHSVLCTYECEASSEEAAAAGVCCLWLGVTELVNSNFHMVVTDDCSCPDFMPVPHLLDDVTSQRF